MKTSAAIAILMFLFCGCAAQKPVNHHFVSVPTWERRDGGPGWPSYNSDYPQHGIWTCPKGYQVWTQALSDIRQEVPQREAFLSELQDHNAKLVCRAQKPKAAIVTQQIVEPVPGHPALHYGPQYYECEAFQSNGCALTRNWLTADGKPVLTPSGCLLAKLRITWIFGDRVNMCEKKP